MGDIEDLLTLLSFVAGIVAAMCLVVLVGGGVAWVFAWVSGRSLPPDAYHAFGTAGIILPVAFVLSEVFLWPCHHFTGYTRLSKRGYQKR